MIQNRQSLVLAAILLLMTVAAYSNSFHNSFQFDDSHAIVNNIFIRSISNIPLFFKDSTTISALPANQTYRPIMSASLAIDYWLGNGLSDTFYFHLSMFIMFVFQGILMVFFYRRVFTIADCRHANIFTALIAAGWYLLHPANAETINYMVARSDSFSAMFIVLAFVLFCNSTQCRKWHLYLIPLVLGLLTKPVVSVFPVLLLFYCIFFEEHTSLPGLFCRQGLLKLRAAFKKAAPSFIVTLLILIFIKMMEPSTWTPGGASQFHYVITQPYVILKYFISFFLPVALSADTDLTPFKSIADSRFYMGLLFLVALLAAAVKTSIQKRLRPISFGLLWFIITLLPTSLIPLAEVMNDHRVFLPYIGLMLSACWAAYLFLEYYGSRKSFRYCNAITAVFIALLLSASAYGTYQRNEVWKTEETLWRDVTEKSPQNGRGLMNYGLALMKRGNYSGAEKYFLKALEITPDYGTLHINLGVLYEATVNNKQAEAYFKRAITLQPRSPEGYYYYGRFLNKQKRYAEAAANLESALRLASAHLNARSLIISVYLELGDVQKAADAASHMLRIAGAADKRAVMLLESIKSGKSKEEILAETKFNVDTPDYYVQLSLGYYRSGDFEKSIAAAQKALQLRPGYDLAYNNICTAYSELKQWDKAIEAGEEALKLNPGNQLARNNLLWAKQQKQLGEKK